VNWFREPNTVRHRLVVGPASAAFSMKQGEISGPLNMGASQAVLQILVRKSLPQATLICQATRSAARASGSQKAQEVLTLFVPI